MLERDVDNLKIFFGQFAPELLTTQYGKEIWRLFEAGELTLETPLTGKIEVDNRAVDMDSLLGEIEDARLEEEARVRREQELRGE